MDQDTRVFEVLESVETKLDKREDKLIVLSCGVTLETRPVPPMVLAEIDKKFPEPSIPKVRDEEKGRDIPNPQDPSYLKALDTVAQAKGNAIIDVIAGLGTKLHSVPDGMYRPEDEDWKEPLEFLGLFIPEKGTGRYLAWLKYYVIRSGEDLGIIVKKSAKAIGVPEEEVASAIATFQSIEERKPNTEH